MDGRWRAGARSGLDIKQIELERVQRQTLQRARMSLVMPGRKRNNLKGIALGNSVHISAIHIRFHLHHNGLQNFNNNEPQIHTPALSKL